MGGGPVVTADVEAMPPDDRIDTLLRLAAWELSQSQSQAGAEQGEGEEGADTVTPCVPVEELRLGMREVGSPLPLPRPPLAPASLDRQAHLT